MQLGKSRAELAIVKEKLTYCSVLPEPKVTAASLFRHRIDIVAKLADGEFKNRAIKNLYEDFEVILEEKDQTLEFRNLLSKLTAHLRLGMGKDDLLEITVQAGEQPPHKFKIIFSKVTYRFELLQQSDDPSACKLIQSAQTELIFTSHEICFKFSAKRTLTLTAKAKSDLMPLKCSIIAPGWKVHLKGLNLSSFKARELQSIIFSQKVVIRDLAVAAVRLHNTDFVEAERIKLQVKSIENHGNFYVLAATEIKVLEFNNDNGNFHGGGILSLNVADLSNLSGKISGLDGTFIKINRSFRSNEASEVGFRNDKKGSVTVLDFRLTILAGLKLGLISGSKVRLNEPVKVQQGVIIGEHIDLNSRNCIEMLGVDFITPQLKIVAPDFALSPQANCDKTILEVILKKSAGKVQELPSAFKLSHSYKTKGKFEIIEAGMQPKSVKTKMLSRFGEIKDYAATQLKPAEYQIILQASVDALNGIKFKIPAGKVIVDIEDFNQDVGKEHKGLISVNGKFKVYATEIDLAKTGVVCQNGLLWGPLGVQLGRLVEEPNVNVIVNLPVNVVHDWYHRRLFIRGNVFALKNYERFTNK